MSAAILEQSREFAMALARREARLRAEFAEQYAGVPVNQWRPISEIRDRVTASRLLRGRRSGEFLASRTLDDRHFDYRGGVTHQGECMVNEAPRGALEPALEATIR